MYSVKEDFRYLKVFEDIFFVFKDQMQPNYK